MVLTDKEIRTYAKREEEPLITPFHEDQLQAASYDVKLSGRIASFKKGTLTIDLEGRDPLSLYENQNMGEKGYILEPNEYILAQLQEKLTIPENWVAHIRPRTRFTRLGLLVADQHCNPTYSGQLYIGIFNASPNAIHIKQGTVIAQVVFEQLAGDPSKEKLYKNKENAAYMNESEFRGSVLGEGGWPETIQNIYQNVMQSLNKE